MHGPSQWVTVLPFFLMTPLHSKSCCYPCFLRWNFFKATKNACWMVVLGNSFDKKLKPLFNLLADIISNEEEKQNKRHFSLKGTLMQI